MIEVHEMPSVMTDEQRNDLEEFGFPTVGHFLETGFMEPEIQPVYSPVKVAGTAVTVKITAPDSALVHLITGMLRKNDVLVVDTGGDTLHAPVGEMVALAAQASGARAIVVNGVCTDVAEIEEMGIPVFARGTSLLTTKLHGTLDGAINAQVSCGGVVVSPGDIVLADDNGVMVLPLPVLERVMPLVEQSEADEDSMRERVLAGEPLARLTGADNKLQDSLSADQVSELLDADKAGVSANESSGESG